MSVVSTGPVTPLQLETRFGGDMGDVGLEGSIGMGFSASPGVNAETINKTSGQEF